MTSNLIRNMPLEMITPDPDQPRKVFGATELRELAASIKENGLLQPITVRKAKGLGYWIVAGERRYRAHQINEAATIKAIIVDPADNADVRVNQIIENDQRVDVTPLEQAHSYRKLMDEAGWTEQELGKRIGKSVANISARVALLGLREEYQQLLASGNLKALEASQMARLSPRGQDVLFQAIKSGRSHRYDIRAAADALANAETQSSFLPEPEPHTEEEKKAVKSFEQMVNQIATMLNSSIRDNQVIAIKKVNRDRANTLAELFRAMSKDMRRIEVALRETAIKADLLSA
jgi:ParB family transcriptional regulator, chromosome partitioning protein